MRIEYAAEFDATAAEAFAVIADVERWHEWTPSITSVTRLDGTGPLTLGDRARVRQPRMPVLVWTVTEVVPDRRFVWESRAAGGRSVGGHEVTPVVGVPGQVRARLWVELTGPMSRLLWILSGPRFRRYVRWELAGWQQRCASLRTA